jgi:hypothetical protein
MDLMLLGVSWVWWAIGTFGLIGTALMIWLAPTVLVGLLKVLGTFFFTTRIGAAILAASIAFFVADVNRSRSDEAEFAARTAQFNAEQDERDKQIETDTRDQVWIDIADQTALNKATDTDVKEFHDVQTPVLATDACSALVHVGNNVDRLRVIAGTPVRKSGRSKGVPKARKSAAGT